jgi:hypothetical protein
METFNDNEKDDTILIMMIIIIIIIMPVVPLESFTAPARKPPPTDPQSIGTRHWITSTRIRACRRHRCRHPCYYLIFPSSVLDWIGLDLEREAWWHDLTQSNFVLSRAVRSGGYATLARPIAGPARRHFRLLSGIRTDRPFDRRCRIV